MSHPVAAAAFAAGFLDAKPATAHPLDLWRERLSAVPFGKVFSMEHRPEAISGWPLDETTIWSATTAVPPFMSWPDGYGEVSSYYASLPALDGKVAQWERAVRAMGYEVVAEPRLPDRAIAIRAGIGVHGLFGPLITPLHGSFVALSTMLVRMPPPEGTRGPAHDGSPGCGACGRCAKACPAGAISADGLDATKCLRRDIGSPRTMPESHYALMERRIMGCDTCQRACPHNDKISPVAPPGDLPAPFLLEVLLDAPDTDAVSARIGTRYTKENSLQIQAVLAAANTGRTDLLPDIRALADADDATLRRVVAWALRRLEEKSV